MTRPAEQSPFVSIENPAADGRDDARQEMPEHLIALPDDKQWALWRCVGLRGAGFPAALVHRLAAPESAAAADRLLAAQGVADAARQQALAEVNRALDELNQGEAWQDKSRRNPLLDALRQLKAGKLPKPVNDSPAANEAIQAVRRTATDCETAAAAYQAVFGAQAGATSRTIREIAASPQFQEAIIWQNRAAFHTAIQPLLRKAPDGKSRGSKQRQHEELIANYIQRYSVKNDTIGFFGPVGWARIKPEAERLVARPGASLLAARTVYFEIWCMDALARRFGEAELLRRWMRPRHMPFIRVDGQMLYLGRGEPSRLRGKQALVLRLCDGRRAAREIAALLLGHPASGVKGEEEVYLILKDLAARGIISWGLELPNDSHPEQVLRRLLEGVGDAQARQAASGALAELVQKRAEVTASAGDAARLDRALEALETGFERLTGTASTRASGQTYAGRTLVFEDCRRDVEVEVGQAFLEDLGAPLSLLLASARWITHKMAEVYRRAFREIYKRAVRESGSAVVDGVSFWHLAHPFLFGDGQRLTDAVESAAQDRWAGVLRLPAGQRHVVYRSEALRDRVLAAFDAPRCGWQFARYHSPDIMVQAESLDAVRRGDYRLVMGELHCAINTLGASLFIDQHPDPAELWRAVDADMREPRLVPIVPKGWPNAILRTRNLLKSEKDVLVLLAHDSIAAPGAGALPLSELVLEETGEGLMVTTRDGRFKFEIIEALADILSSFAVNGLKLVRATSHTPRITIDRLIVCRESWRFVASEAAFALAKDESERFLGARRWAARRGIPRFVFVKVPVETKPFYLDFSSPIYTEVFAKMIRRTMESDRSQDMITMSEMLPATGETWLADAEGKTYTSEFRIVAVDRCR